MTGIHIRKFEKNDRVRVRKICYETLFLETPGDYFVNPEIFADLLTKYFTDYEPESCFVACVNNEVVGYLTGTKNVRKMRLIFWCRIFPELLWLGISSGLFIKSKSRILVKNIVMSFFKGEFFVPDFSSQYPAIFHINIDQGFRGSQLGGRLVLAFLDYCKSQGIKGVHVSTMSENARAFFTHMGFVFLYQGKRSYVKSPAGKAAAWYILGYSVIEH